MHQFDNSVNSWLAHSARPEQGIPAQDYSTHVSNVCTRCRHFVSQIKPPAAMQRYFDFLTARLMLAAEYHDLGKLAAANQAVLRGLRKARTLPIKHWDAGAMYMTQCCAPLSALLIYAHHKGLPDLCAQNHDKSLKYGSGDETSREDSKHNLQEYLELHNSVMPWSKGKIKKIMCKIEEKDPVSARLLLSCLVDADHSDTAVNYNDLDETEMPLLRAQERLEALDRYVNGLSESGTKQSERNLNRSLMYQNSRNADTAQKIIFCDSPVGSGKTTAIAAYQLKTAADMKLRHIFIILPYTNILDQTVKVLRNALRLPDESACDMKRVVSAVHHKADFDDENSRKLSVLWRAPVVVTTAVQFFETMAAATPSTLRKLHELPDSSVFIDEAHTALPVKLWPLAWEWIKSYANCWNCHFILGSGSLYKLWKLPEIDSSQPDIPALLSEDFRMKLYKTECNRVRYRYKKEKMNEEELCDWLLTLKGPRLVILNTVQSAAVIAQLLEKRCGRNAVEHISAALAPADRALLVDKIKSRLANRDDDDWTLVATSCVEAGVDFSFRNGVREAAALVNLLQTAGRIKRNNEKEYVDSTVWTVQLNFDGMLKRHPCFEISSRILLELFAKNEALCSENDDLSALCTLALKRELNEQNGLGDTAVLKHEQALEYKKVEDNFQVIGTTSVTVIVDQALKERLENYEPVDWQELQDYSVQIYCFSAAKLGAEKLKNHQELYYWPYKYDDFIGYMAGVLDNKKIDMVGAAFL